MRLCTYSRQSVYGREKRLGIFFNETTILDPQRVWQLYFEKKGFYNSQDRARYKMPSLLSKVLSFKENPLESLQDSLEQFKKQLQQGDLKTKSGVDLAFDIKDDPSSKLECPMDSINCYRDFYTHEKHVAAGFKKRNEDIPEAWYEIPAYYKGPTTGFIGHEEDILWPHYTKKLDFELELACVIAKDGKNIKEKNALNHILGFTILNDISARDIQKKEMAVRLGPAKGKDFCSVLGPVITTIDEFDYKEPNLKMNAFINEEQWSEGYSGDAHYSWAEMISHASQEEWLRSSDVLGSGTVGTGCGLELDRWIQPSDIIELKIESIGTLKNLVGIPQGEPHE